MKKLLTVKLTDAKNPGLILQFGEDNEEPNTVTIIMWLGQSVSDVAETLRFLADELTK